MEKWSFSFGDFLRFNVPDVRLWFTVPGSWNFKPVCRYHLSLLNYLKASQTYLFAFSNTNIFSQKSKVEVVVLQKNTNIESRLFGFVLFAIGVFPETCCGNEPVRRASVGEASLSREEPHQPGFSPHTFQWRPSREACLQKWRSEGSRQKICPAPLVPSLPCFRRVLVPPNGLLARRKPPFSDLEVTCSQL